MNIFILLNTALKVLNNNKVRTVLTMLGVIIGVASVIILMSIGKGLQNYITQQFEAIGSNLVFVSPGQRGFGRDPATAFGNNKLGDVHENLLNTYADSVIKDMTPYVTSAKTVKYKSDEYIASIFSGKEGFVEIFNYEIINGRTFTRQEFSNAENVILVGAGVKKELFPTQNVLGKEVKIGDGTFTIIGELKDKGQSTYDSVLMPLKTMEREFSVNNYTGFVIKVKDENQIDRSIKIIERALLRDLGVDDFNVLSQQDALDTLTSILGTLTMGLGAIAGISLLVGGIGIMNIMLVTVTERTKEIGLRKALGATSRDVATQFLVESILISVGGGLIGIGLGFIVEAIARQFFPVEITPFAVFLSFSVSVFIGLTFGTYPAIQASRKDPIVALRYE